MTHMSGMGQEAFGRVRAGVPWAPAGGERQTRHLLATVQSIARQMMEAGPEGFTLRFSQRLRSLAATDDLQAAATGPGVDLGELLQAQLRLFDARIARRVRVAEPAVDLSVPAAQTMGLILHELASNAAQHGALSTAGEVAVAWSLAEDRFRLVWTEFGGPVTLAPTRGGFGTRVLTTVAGLNFDADICRRFDPAGLSWSMECAAARVLAESGWS